jgi:hypothetical protein
MTPGTLVLVGPDWDGITDALRSYGWTALTGIDAASVPAAALAVGRALPRPPLVLVGRGEAGKLLPGLAVAQRAARRPVGGYVFVDADLTMDREHDHLPVDWPDAPCGYLQTDPAYAAQTRVAELRGWPVRTAVEDPAAALHDLVLSL